MAEPEFITIIEGPTPEFTSHNNLWALSLLEGAGQIGLDLCRLRTFNGPGLVERCRNAWSEGRPVVLDYPNRLGLRQHVQVIAARAEESEEGGLLHLWTRALDAEEDE